MKKITFLFLLPLFFLSSCSEEVLEVPIPSLDESFLDLIEQWSEPLFFNGQSYEISLLESFDGTVAMFGYVSNIGFYPVEIDLYYVSETPTSLFYLSGIEYDLITAGRSFRACEKSYQGIVRYLRSLYGVPSETEKERRARYTLWEYFDTESGEFWSIRVDLKKRGDLVSDFTITYEME